LPELRNQLLMQQSVLIGHQPVGPMIDPVELLGRR
jgi:hypothetical protein